MIVDDDDDVLAQINWDCLLDESPGCGDFFCLEPPSSLHNRFTPSPDSISSWIGGVENILMNDDDHDGGHVDLQGCNDFLADILADSPADVSGEVVDVSTDKEFSDSDNCRGVCALQEEEEEEEEEKGKETVADDGIKAAKNQDGEDPNDPVYRKRRRQLRNRDAAVRSRERKKEYVRDLELKSKYLEGECRRLDRLLQFFTAENQALRLSMQKCSAFGVTSAKQESAVLLLESLLLGSLLWFLGIMCLFTLPAWALVEVPLENVERKSPEKVALRGARSQICRLFLVHSFINSRRCKASRTKMRPMAFSMNVMT